eukprot:TRINITY_DN4540_c0_g1_i3.p1 TRINITY_DN4540_c0_g1~~TRINITY_DN4540_c0_g1_i3.p1  ORF type:complete len:257 (+),score=29.67 TRINITY_DN4540_c0_g1_i3:710-1480(+)
MDVDYDLLKDTLGSTINDPIRFQTHNVGQIVQLRVTTGDESTSKSESDIYIANTHLYWNPEDSDVKFYQMRELLQQSESFIQLSQPISGVQQTPFIVVGDFNSLPDSAVYELLDKGFVDIHTHEDFARSKVAHPEENLLWAHIQSAIDLDSKANSVVLIDETESTSEEEGEIHSRAHSFEFVDVYRKDGLKQPDDDADRAPTVITQGFRGCIDYIWVTQALHKLDAIAIQTFPEDVSLPTTTNGSDHLPLCLKFVL